MQAKPEIQGIHQHVELSLESQVTEPDSKAADAEQDESDLEEVQENQTETISGSQVVCAMSRMTDQAQQSSKSEQLQVVMFSVGAVLALVGIYVAIVLL